MRQQVAGKAVPDDADLLEACYDVLRLQPIGRLRDLVPEHGPSAGLNCDLADDPGGAPAAQYQ